MGLSRKTIVGMLFAGGILLAGTCVGAAGKPNILVIWGDDIGQTNISAYTRGRHWFRSVQHVDLCY